MSKGSKRRPRQIDEEVFEDNWEKVFGKKNKSKRKQQNNRRWYDNKENVE